MRAVIQRVLKANVTVDSKIVGKIDKGLCVLVGLTHDDTENDLDYIVKKLLNLRLFDDSDGKFWCKSVKDLELEILSVSQFTLYAETRKGNKPDFHKALKSDLSQPLYNIFLNKLRTQYYPDKIQDGEFGAMMELSIVNDGPVTITIDSKKPSSSNSPS